MILTWTASNKILFAMYFMGKSGFGALVRSMFSASPPDPSYITILTFFCNPVISSICFKQNGPIKRVK